MDSPIIGQDLHRGELIVDDFAWVDHLIDQVTDGISSARCRQVRAGHAPLVIEAMTGIATRCCEHLSSVVKISVGEMLTCIITEFVECPLLLCPVNKNFA